jgi:hypothetical protein
MLIATDSKTSPEGELVIDHRASPGLPPQMAQAIGLPAQYLGEGRMYEAAVLYCHHCGVPQIKNLNRTRPRYSCAACGIKYVCDVCASAASQPGYVHRSLEEISDMIRSGRWIVSGSTSAPVLTEVTHG